MNRGEPYPNRECVTGALVSCLVGKPEDGFSRVGAQLTEINGRNLYEIRATLYPLICLSRRDVSVGVSLELATQHGVERSTEVETKCRLAS